MAGRGFGSVVNHWGEKFRRHGQRAVHCRELGSTQHHFPPVLHAAWCEGMQGRRNGRSPKRKKGDGLVEACGQVTVSTALPPRVAGTATGPGRASCVISERERRP
jgi:hypothetical protein